MQYANCQRKALTPTGTFFNLCLDLSDIIWVVDKLGSVICLTVNHPVCMDVLDTL